MESYNTALPDKNQEEVTPKPVMGGTMMGSNTGGNDAERNTALPDENQSRVLPAYQVGSVGPNPTLGVYGPGYVEMPTDEDSGTKIGENDSQYYQVPGTPHYGAQDSSKGHDN